MNIFERTLSKVNTWHYWFQLGCNLVCPEADLTFLQLALKWKAWEKNGVERQRLQTNASSDAGRLLKPLKTTTYPGDGGNMAALFRDHWQKSNLKIGKHIRFRLTRARKDATANHPKEKRGTMLEVALLTRRSRPDCRFWGRKKPVHLK